MNIWSSAVYFVQALKPSVESSAEVLAAGSQALLAARPMKKLLGQNAERGPELQV